MSLNITVTDSALAHIQKIITKEACLALRLSVKKTGCSGYAYALERIHAINEKDTLFSLQDTLLYLDTAWLKWFDGLTIDLIEEKKFGLKQKRLAFLNPKEKARCGCGESFQMKEPPTHVS